MLDKIVPLNEEVIKGQIKELVRGSVEETLNGLLEEEAQKLTQAARYERSAEQQAYRSGHYQRNPTTTSGDVTLNVPRLKGVTFETAIIERYRRRESSVEEALIENLPLHTSGKSPPYSPRFASCRLIPKGIERVPSPAPHPTRVGEETANVESDSNHPTGIDFEPQKPNAVSEILTVQEPLRDNPTPSTTASQTPSHHAPVAPQMGNTRTADGQNQIYILGFGWITGCDGGGEGVVVDGDGNINKMVGMMN